MNRILIQADGCREMASGVSPETAFELLSWRRAVAQLYAQVRAEPEPERAHALWRSGRDQLFRGHRQSPLAQDDPLRETGLPYAPYDPALRTESAVRSVDGEPVTLRIDTGTDGVTVLEQFGWVRMPEAIGAPEVAVWWLPQYAGGVFLPLRDGSAGRMSYGAGRYLLDTAKGADLGGAGGGGNHGGASGGGVGRLVLDLNFLYHPSCRYNPRWVCPLATAANRIPAVVTGGEIMPTD